MFVEKMIEAQSHLSLLLFIATLYQIHSTAGRLAKIYEQTNKFLFAVIQKGKQEVKTKKMKKM